MTADKTRELFAQIRAFEWDEAKRESNFRKHHIDFKDAVRVIDGPTIVCQSSRSNESRYLVYGFIDDDEVALICTIRGDRCRIISTRRARKSERKKYHRRLQKRSKEG